ncbi:DNA primase [Candidatus Dependentiae bacterium]|nr:MAG: DNA primase [Candidatus Dependentiae bacterium]
MNIFSYLKSQLSIQDVVSEYTTLHKAGAYLKSRCPFHHEKTASFTISPDKDIFYCFGCHTGGDVISFIAKVENCSPLEAAQFLAERHSIQLPEDINFSEQTQSQEEKKQHYDVCRTFAQWCHQQLQKHPSVLQHLHDRGIDQNQIDQFTIGFFPGGLASIKQCIHAVKKERFLVDDLMQAHILMQGKSILYSPFEDRIIFPIKDHLGRFCAFGGRVFKPHDTRPKYYNSKESEFFTKGSIVFGLDTAKKSIQERKTVFLVEGYTDCIAMVQHGYPNTVATLGTACTEQHLKLLSRYADYLCILYDSDAAGEQAILRLTKLCWHVNMELRVVHLPTGQDPASFLAAGNCLKSRIEQAQDIFNFFINSLSKDFAIKPLHEKVRKIRSIVETIQSIEDPLKQDILLQNAARTFDVPVESLRRELNQKGPRRPQPNVPSPADTEGQGSESSISNLEKRIFCAIINNMDLLKSQHESYVIEYISSPLKEILQTLQTKKLDGSSFEFANFFDTISEQEKQFVSQLLLEHDESGDSASYGYLVQQLQKKHWKRIVRDITTKLGQAQQKGDLDMVQRILDNFHALKEKIIPRYR